MNKDLLLATIKNLYLYTNAIKDDIVENSINYDDETIDDLIVLGNELANIVSFLRGIRSARHELIKLKTK